VVQLAEKSVLHWKKYILIVSIKIIDIVNLLLWSEKPIQIHLNAVILLVLKTCTVIGTYQIALKWSQANSVDKAANNVVVVSCPYFTRGYSRTSITRTWMARIPWITRTVF
jgi:hypothetical protein